MASSGTFICLATLLAACCMMTEARGLGKIRKARQNLFEVPFDQTQPYAGSSPLAASSVGGSAGGGGFDVGVFAGDGGSDDVVASDSESSEEYDEVEPASIDTALVNGVDAADGPAMVGGHRHAIGGNLSPILRGDKGMTFQTKNKDQLLSRTSGSSGTGVGIAFAVLCLLAVAIGAAAFVLMKYRHSIPVLVWA
ncbi:uncharacterized protein LOC100891699 [Strongylocentrotus purpuratus]|uniref:Uncharacterized protein n=1 Tax=Strongylocentrotus purpuratus TaxID=7668 RepID=A0A7M7GFB3_STRPU|nr:uncharacterized protein LOC100891699 [Strongylocentrotus purpuratus]|eukprot:XP_003725273.1 PREDICTED: uncharacterized protein LOC100891699 [Strongylocentrotus purpuratus]